MSEQRPSTGDPARDSESPEAASEQAETDDLSPRQDDQLSSRQDEPESQVSMPEPRAVDAEGSTPSTIEAESAADAEDGGEVESRDLGDGQGPLLPDDQTDRFISRWEQIQAAFVDEPRQSVEQADALVADLMQRLAGSFSNERQRLEEQWEKGDDVSTEDLRVSLTHYRSFFERLLST